MNVFGKDSSEMNSDT